MPAQRCTTAHNNRQGKGVDPSEMLEASGKGSRIGRRQ